MKKYIIIFAALLYSKISLGQTSKVDTLRVFENKTWVKYTIYKDSVVQSERSCYLYYIGFRTIPRIFFLGRGFLKKKVEMDSLVWHGESIEYREDHTKKTSTYIDGLLIESKCYSKKGEELNIKECDKKYNIRDGSGTIYRIHKNKK